MNRSKQRGRTRKDQAEAGNLNITHKALEHGNGKEERRCCCKYHSSRDRANEAALHARTRMGATIHQLSTPQLTHQQAHSASTLPVREQAECATEAHVNKHTPHNK